MVRQCCKCKKLDFLNPNLTFHRFPKDPDKRKIWIQILKLETKAVPKICNLCSDHFDENNFIYNARGVCILKDDVFPKSESTELPVVQGLSFKNQIFEFDEETEEKFEATEASIDLQHIEDKTAFENYIIKSESMGNVDEARKEETKFDSIEPDIQVKIESSETAFGVNKIDVSMFHSYAIKNEEVVLKEDAKSNETSILPTYFGKRKRRNEETKCKLFKCPECSYETPLKSHLKRHVNCHTVRPIEQNDSHRDPRIFKCDICDYETTNKSFFIKHIRRHQLPGQVNTYMCNQCNYETMWKNYLNIHLRRHKDPEELKMFNCKRCSYETKWRPCLRAHIMRFHTDNGEVEVYRCYCCEYRTFLKYRLIKHVVRHQRKDVNTNKDGY